MKNCSKCSIEKVETEFSRNQRWCKLCMKEHNTQYRLKNRDKIIKRREVYNTTDAARESNKKYLAKVEVKQQRKIYKEEYRSRPEVQEHEKEHNKMYNKSEAGIKRRNVHRAKPEYKKKSAEYVMSRYNTDINYRLAHVLRTRLCKALKNNQKVGSAIDALGCTIQHLKLHLELFWDEGMTWENYGNGDNQWSIDHIIPLSSFDLTNEEQFKKANYFGNLQPLWQRDNLLKSNFTS